MPLTDHHRQITRAILPQINARLAFLQEVGLGYLSLDRTLRTLSGGEAQRVSLTSVLGSNLVNMLYVLDEPSVGLHPRDIGRLTQSIRRLQSRGNSVVVVEHEEELIRAADELIEIGPAAGDRGGEVSFQGPLAEMLQPSASLTGEFLAARRGVSLPTQRRPTNRGWIKLFGARGNNLQNITVDFPLNVLCLVTGVSGAGKSTLVQDTLYGALCRRKRKECDEPLPFDDVVGDGQIDDVILVDQSPIGRTPRSNPATYTGAFTPIREWFAELPEAKARGYQPGRFSFNVKGGRCEKCEGDGVLKIEMNFLPPVYVTCEACNGKRYNRETLEINFKGLNIADILNLTVDEAVTFFRAVPKICDPCLVMAEVGLGYLRLGQAATTLSGGEAQRVKLAAELGRKSRGRTLYLLDEPTTGLHFHDVSKLLEVLFKLRVYGNTLIVIEHNLDVIKTADWVIDLGPEGGAGGGEIVAQGPPEIIAKCERSQTGKYLARVLGKG